ncbi:MAG: BRO family protein [Dysosmobacter sp.]|uniref:BRO-N domain-containing protein n=1 Tax=uncultured Oscillibacter sp. TaxID=876091 RepID=UPI00260245D6|nr:BRO family protein [uncultured Oscillibacter sp.]MCX4371958.1 BRO family protein [Dysosmobacter sp.]
MNDLQIFNYHNTPLRTVEKDGELWWVLKDVCDILGIANPRNVAARLDDDEKSAVHLADSIGRMQEITVINEPGLYKVILRSDKPDAKDLMRFVTHEVLPSIRQHGAYSLAQTQSLTPAQLIAAQAQLLVDMEKRMDEVAGQTRALEAKVDTAMKAFSRPAEDHWRADMDRAIKELNADMGWSLPKLRGKLFAELEQAVNCNLNARVKRLQERKRKNGMRYRDARELGKLDAIAADKQLRAIFEGIVRAQQARAVPARKGEAE